MQAVHIYILYDKNVNVCEHKLLGVYIIIAITFIHINVNHGNDHQ